MWDWAERFWAGEDARIATIAFEYDTARTALLAQRGYRDTGKIELVRIYDLSRSIPEAIVPEGFRIAALAEIGDPAGRVALENSIWNATLDDAWFRGKSSAPTYSYDWDLVVVSPEGQQVAASLVWIDARNRYGEIDPLGTHPDYRRLGLARALVAESFGECVLPGCLAPTSLPNPTLTTSSIVCTRRLNRSRPFTGIAGSKSCRPGPRRPGIPESQHDKTEPI